MTGRMYVIYDTESTGTNPRYDQILQHAALLTDGGFRELDNFNVRSQRLPYKVARPKALEVTGVDPWTIDDAPAMSPHAFAKFVHATFQRWSPACFLGYNIINFDEEIQRQMFWENLLYTYVTNSKQSFRADLLVIMRAWSAIKPDTFRIPENDQGKPSFKLEHIAPHNGFENMDAHDAQGDNYASAFMARLLAENDPDLWEQLTALGRPAVCDQILQQPLVRLLTHYGTPETHLTTPVATNPSNNKEWCVFDLSVDPAPYLDLTETQLRDKLNTDFKILRTVKTNRQPIVMRDDDPRAPAITADLDRATAETRMQQIRQHPYFKVRLAQALAQQSAAFDAKTDKPLEERIYGGFPSNADKNRMDRFHELDDWAARYDLVRGFEDERLRQIGLRVIMTEAPEALPADTLQRLRAGIAERRLLVPQDNNPWTTVEGARQNLEEVSDPELRARISEWIDAVEAHAHSWRQAPETNAGAPT